MGDLVKRPGHGVPWCPVLPPVAWSWRRGRCWPLISCAICLQTTGPASKCATSLGTRPCAPAFLAMPSWQTVYPVKVGALGPPSYLRCPGVGASEWGGDTQHEGGGPELNLTVVLREQLCWDEGLVTLVSPCTRKHMYCRAGVLVGRTPGPSCHGCHPYRRASQSRRVPAT